MLVYVAFRSEDDQIIGVYSSEEKAKEMAVKDYRYVGGEFEKKVGGWDIILKEFVLDDEPA